MFQYDAEKGMIFLSIPGVDNTVHALIEGLGKFWESHTESYYRGLNNNVILRST